MRDLLPRVRVDLPETGMLDLAALFGREPRRLVLEIGFGGGEHLAALAAQNPDVDYIGCEPFENGVASLLGHIDSLKLSNIRIYPDDAGVLLKALSTPCLDEVYLLFPDPWPKKRHTERRFLNIENINILATKFKLDAHLHAATDVSELANWMRAQVDQSDAFQVVYDSAVSPQGWVTTRYEAKGVKAGRSPRYIVCRKNKGDDD